MTIERLQYMLEKENIGVAADTKDKKVYMYICEDLNGTCAIRIGRKELDELIAALFHAQSYLEW